MYKNYTIYTCYEFVVARVYNKLVIFHFTVETIQRDTAALHSANIHALLRRRDGVVLHSADTRARRRGAGGGHRLRRRRSKPCDVANPITV